MDHIAVAVTFAYMWSAHQHLGPPGAWHPHMMVFAPNYDNAMVGGFAFGSPLPQLSDGLPAAGDGRARFRGRERERLPNLRADAKRHPVLLGAGSAGRWKVREQLDSSSGPRTTVASAVR